MRAKLELHGIFKTNIAVRFLQKLTLVRVVFVRVAHWCYARRFQPPARAPDASTLESVAPAEAPARAARTAPARARVSLVQSLPSPSRPVHDPCHVHALRRYVKAAECEHDSVRVPVTAHANGKRMPHSSARTVWVGALALIARACRMCTTILADWRMRERLSRRTNELRTQTQNACTARFRTVFVGACIATCEQNVCHGQH